MTDATNDSAATTTTANTKASNEQPQAASDQAPAPQRDAGARGRDRAELRSDHHRADDQHGRVGDDRDRGEDHGQHQEDVEGQRGYGAAVGLAPRPPPRSPRRQGVPASSGSSSRASANGVLVGVVSTMPPRSVELELVEARQQARGALPRDVALDQVALGPGHSTELHGHVGGAVMGHQHVAHGLGQVGGHRQAEVDEHGRQGTASDRWGLDTPPRSLAGYSTSEEEA